MMSTNKNKFLRNTIVLLDFVIVNVILSTYYMQTYVAGIAESMFHNQLPLLLLCANSAMILAQMFFSTIVHEHYKSIDKVMRQITLLSLSYAISFVLLLEGSKYCFNTASPSADFTVHSVLYVVLCLICLRICEYLLIKQLRIFGRNSRNVLFVGEAKLLVDAYEKVDIMPYAGLRIMGYYSDVPIENNDVKMEYLGTLQDLKSRIEADKTGRLSDDIYCTELSNGTQFITQLVDYSMRNGIQFNYIPSLLNDFGYCLRPRVEGELVVFSNLNEPLQLLGNRILKRTFDIIVSFIAILFILPFIPIIGLTIKISSPGPIFFKQKRTGLNGKDFNMLKFRSMHVNADADKLQATKDDPRKFAFGNFMRKANIDELPQFFNVFVGDMSIVGPRPHMLAHTDEYRKKIYEYMMRHLVRPGITGWAQTTGFRGETPELWQMSGRVERDIWYIQNWSFWLDIRIIFRTALQFFVHDKNAF